MSILKVIKGKNYALVYTQTNGPDYRAVVVFARGASQLGKPAVNLQLTVKFGAVTVTKPDGSQRQLAAGGRLVIPAGQGPYTFENTDSEPCVCLTQNGDHGGPPYQPPKPPG
jgi:hypothetical protein